MNRLNPIVGAAVSNAEAMQPRDIPAIAQRAEAGFGQWAKPGPGWRVRIAEED